MTLVTELDLPAFGYTAPDFLADCYHGQLAQVRAQGWLARSPLANLVLDREAGEFFLRSRAAAFPGRQIAEFFGITSGPLWDHIDTNTLNLTGAQHRRLRALVGPAFTPRAAERDSRLLTFGAGTHFCPGANLARAELEEALTFLAPRMPGLALAGDPERGGVEGIYGLDALPLRWTT
jgi:cytochrome P450